jgi:hypothetical protein
MKKVLLHRSMKTTITTMQKRYSQLCQALCSSHNQCKNNRYSAAAVINQINNDPLGITINKPWG